MATVAIIIKNQKSPVAVIIIAAATFPIKREDWVSALDIPKNLP